MRYKHILLEGYCSFDKPYGNVRCKEYDGKMGQYCIECKYFSYTDAPNALVLVNHNSVTEKEEDFGAYMYEFTEKEEVDKWNEICRKKISESIEEIDLFVKEVKKNEFI